MAIVEVGNPDWRFIHWIVQEIQQTIVIDNLPPHR
jgi:hypothetical protein